MSGNRTGKSMKTLLVLLYLWNGSLKLDTIPMKDYAACQSEGPALAENLSNSPRFEGGLFAACIDMPSNMKVVL